MSSGPYCRASPKSTPTCDAPDKHCPSSPHTTPAKEPPATAAWETAIESFRAAAKADQGLLAALLHQYTGQSVLRPATTLSMGTKKGPPACKGGVIRASFEYPSPDIARALAYRQCQRMWQVLTAACA